VNCLLLIACLLLICANANADDHSRRAILELIGLSFALPSHAADLTVGAEPTNYDLPPASMLHCTGTHRELACREGVHKAGIETRPEQI
jgi:hypothetical protein